FFAGNGNFYTFVVTATTNGVVNINIPAGVAIDYQGNLNTASNQLSRTFGNEYPVYTSSNSGGTISPVSASVGQGLTTSFTVVPYSGYTMTVSGCGGSLVGNTYTTGAIVAICTVTATFTQIATAVLPTVTTGAATSINMNFATGNGNITNIGNQVNSKRGIVYDTSSHALPGNVAPASSSYPNKVEEIGSFNTGAFTENITGLTSNTTYYMRAYSYNSVGYSYGGEVSFTTNIYPTVTLSGYRIFSNINTLNVGTALEAQNTAHVFSNSGDSFRLRFLLHIANSNLSVNGGVFKIQYSLRSGTCDTSFTGESYTDITSDTPVAFYRNFFSNDQVLLTTNANDPTHNSDTVVPQTYVEKNNFSNAIATVPMGQDAEWDVSLFDKSVMDSTSYCVRIIKSDGSLLSGYTVIPEFTTATYKSRGGGGGSMYIENIATPGGTTTGGGSGSGSGSYLTKCSDGIDNDGDNKIDALDPECHAGGTLQGAYVPSNDSETVAPALPTGGCTQNCGGGGGGGDLGYWIRTVYGIFGSQFLRNSMMGSVIVSFR
ncbi:hypothetical protein HXX01_03940, partial [Candidatus Nomurabacteria bacterium]|nr:hypothetical protein [Candidatus Nomurabacteria bacterium]